MRINGIDIGFGFTKATDGKESIIFKSIMGEAIDFQIPVNLITNDIASKLHVTLDGQSYFVGDFAEQQSNVRQFTLDQEKFISDFVRLFALTALGRLNTEYVPINVVSGLPVGFYRDYHQRLMKALPGSHEITFHMAEMSSEIRRININKIRIIPQPLGSLLNLITNDRGIVVNRDLAKQKVGIVDIGFRTTDFCIFDQLRYVGRGSTTTDMGMSKCFSIIAKKLREECGGLNIELYRMYKPIQKGLIKIRGKEYNISKFRDLAFTDAARTIASDMDRLWADEWDMDAIMITGGGAMELTKYLQPLITGNVIPIEHNADLRLNNVEGYLKYGQFLWGNPGPDTKKSASE
jgi:plasmid segregation protein ParM